MRSLKQLVQGLLGLLFVASMGFGATQAFGSSAESSSTARTCPARGYDYAYASCGWGCPGNRGYCGADGICRCGLIP